jgi:hydroxypyruvate reductase
MQPAMSLPILLIITPFADEPLRPAAQHYEIVRWKELQDPAAFLRDRGADVRVVITSGAAGLPQGMAQHLPRLALVACNGVGYDAIDLAWAKQAGVVVTNTPGVLSADVADMAMALLLGVFRQLPAADRFVRQGNWSRGPMPLGRRLSGARVGIVGLGQIGRVIARRCAAFDMPVGYYGRREQADMPYTYFANLNDMAQWAEALVVATPGGADTRHLVDARVLESLGPDGILINIARGSVVDEDALIQALETGRLAGAGLDVFQNEPHVPDRLAALEQVVLTPHIASATVQTRRAMAELVVANVLAHAANGPLPSHVPYPA